MPPYKVHKVEPPEHTFLPFFAYGVFKPNQIAYPRIGKYVDYFKKVTCPYELRERNGMPVLTENRLHGRETSGHILKFNPRYEEKAYKIISKTKAKKLYEWTVLRIDNQNVNVLVGKEPEKTNIFMFDELDFDFRRDPIFYDAIEFIERNLHRYFDNEKERYFNLQMCYMLLWASIERFTTFKYGNNTKRYNNEQFSKERAFKEGIWDVDDSYTVLNSEDLKEYRIIPDEPKKSIRYYYAIRCNVIHTGKSHIREMEFLEKATEELLEIYKNVLDDSFRDYD